MLGQTDGNPSVSIYISSLSAPLLQSPPQEMCRVFIPLPVLYMLSSPERNQHLCLQVLWGIPNETVEKNVPSFGCRYFTITKHNTSETTVYESCVRTHFHVQGCCEDRRWNTTQHAIFFLSWPDLRSVFGMLQLGFCQGGVNYVYCKCPHSTYRQVHCSRAEYI